MSELDKQKTGEIYDPADADIQELQLACLEKMYDYNATRPKEFEKRQRIMKEMLAEVGEGAISSRRSMRISAGIISISAITSMRISTSRSSMIRTSTSETVSCSRRMSC